MCAVVRITGGKGGKEGGDGETGGCGGGEGDTACPQTRHPFAPPPRSVAHLMVDPACAMIPSGPLAPQ
eukprot:1266825-Prymnesium_polylepis.2